MTRPRPAAAPTRIGHVCAPSPAAKVILTRGDRSSVVETCTCGVMLTWIRQAVTGAIIALPAKGDGR